MLEHWKRKQGRTALEWGTNDFEKHETDRPDFRGSRISSYVDGSSILFFPPEEREQYTRQSAVVVFLLICVVIGIVASIYIIRQTFINHGVAPDNAQTYASAINAVQIQLANAGYSLVATELTKRENHRTTTAYEDYLTSKIFAFQFINSYASFFYIAFVAYHLEEQGCGENGCMYALGSNLMIIFATRLLSGNFLELAVPFVIGIYRKYIGQCACCVYIENCFRSKDDQKIFSRAELEFTMAPFDSSAEVITDYMEISIQFGYQVLFVSALPCSSFAALISNVIEVKGDSWKLMNLFQRPVPVLCEDIGAFQGILTVITICAVVSNAAIMRFTCTVLNDFTQQTQWWIFVGFQYFMFLVMYLIDTAIESIPYEVELQRDRAKFLESKLIDRVSDETASLPPPTPDLVPLKEYKHFGSRVEISRSGGYAAATGSKRYSKHPSFSERGRIATSTVQASVSPSSGAGLGSNGKGTSALKEPLLADPVATVNPLPVPKTE